MPAPDEDRRDCDRLSVCAVPPQFCPSFNLWHSTMPVLVPSILWTACPTSDRHYPWPMCAMLTGMNALAFLL
ncbi:hypothetical protein BDZ89DRAFT_1056262 [Hymenopellis radicata]|nr:hypothetical protein BDZ89DRAFT_1056262 [Hymenopellis radicata]